MKIKIETEIVISEKDLNDLVLQALKRKLDSVAAQKSITTQLKKCIDTVIKSDGFIEMLRKRVGEKAAMEIHMQKVHKKLLDKGLWEELEDPE
jgi:hypothetical protein